VAQQQRGEFLEARDAQPRVALAEAAALGAGELRQLLRAPLVDRAGDAAHALQRAVVEQQRDEVGAELHVDLDPGGAGRERFLQREQRVLGAGGRVAAVGDECRSGHLRVAA
jgi:hypothetical protein